MIYYIFNDYNCHYEIIINVVHNYYEICREQKTDNDIIYMQIGYENQDFINYILKYHPYIIFECPESYDYYINCTIYAPSNIQNKNQITIEDNKHFYISHEVFKTNNKNIYFLTPLNNDNYLVCDRLPFQDEIYDDSFPIYIIQGSIDEKRRNYKLLELILRETYDYEFKIKIIGSGEMDPKFDIYKDKLIIKNNLNFTEYHKEFLNCYCLLPLTSKQTQPQYYTNKLTSSINYTLAYKLSCLLDSEMQDIYNLPNAYVYNDENDMVNVFKQSLFAFYNNIKLKCNT
jgi:hypothetical protein